jgi:hypothetical protein
MDGVVRLFDSQAAPLELGRRDERPGVIARSESVSGLVNRGPDPWVRAAPAQVAAHPLVDLRVVGGRV